MMFLDNVFYMYSNMDSSSQILLFLIVLVALMLISIFIINFIIKKKNERYDKKFNPVNRYINVTSKKIEKTNKVKVSKPIKTEIKKPEIKEEVQKEEIEVMEDPEVVEVVSDSNTIDKISMLIEDNINNPKPIDLTKFEEDEEKNAIISYDELVRKAGAKKIVYKTPKTTIAEEKKEEKIEIKTDTEKTKFKASQVISPIYGRKKQEEKKEELEEFIEVEDIPVQKNKNADEEMMNDITFLTSLKTFRSNLD